ncbi:MAG TPA: hypothetical protein PLQ56_03620 [Aggregatilineales bacterium]|nr:hypothetical protein [Aggregatilineales bacterium]
MGERKKKKRGQLREVIVPLPLDSALNRLNNRAAQQQCTVTMNVRKTDLKEADLAIGLFNRSGRPSGFNEFWRTTLTLEQLDEYKTRIEYSPVRLSVTVGAGTLLPLILPAIALYCVSITMFGPILGSIQSAEYPFSRDILLVGLVIMLLLYIRHRRRVLLDLLHDLDKPLGEN